MYMTRLLLFPLAVLATACGGGDSSSTGTLECSAAGGTFVTAMDSCDAALAEGRRLMIENGLAIETAPQSGIEAGILAGCFTVRGIVVADSESGQALADDLGQRVCPASIAGD